MGDIAQAMAAIWTSAPYLVTGLQLTIILSLLSLVGSTIGGTVLAVLRMAPQWWLRVPALLYIDIVRMVPLVMVIFWIFFLIPILIGRTATPTLAALAALILFNSSYMAEVIRAGLQSVPRGLTEAARCSGMGYLQCMRHVVLPIAFRTMLPALVSRLIALVMGTSLASIIGVTEFFRAATDVNNRIFAPYEIYGTVALIYFMLCFSLSILGRALQHRLSPDRRREPEVVLVSA